MRPVFGWLFGFTSRAITLAWGTSSDSSSSRLGFSSAALLLKPVRLPPGRARLATRPAAIGSPTPVHDRDRRGCIFRRLCRNGAWGHDYVDFAAHEVSGQFRQPIVVALRRSVFHRKVFSLDIAGFAQSLLERGQKRIRGGRCATGAEEADHR